MQSDDDGTCSRLELTDPSEAPPPRLGDAILATLTRAAEPMTRTALRQVLRVNNQRLGDALAALEAAGRIVRQTAGWCLP